MRKTYELVTWNENWEVVCKARSSDRYIYRVLRSSGWARKMLPYVDGDENLSQEELNQACDLAYIQNKITGVDTVMIMSVDGANAVTTDME